MAAALTIIESPCVTGFEKTSADPTCANIRSSPEETLSATAVIDSLC